MPGRQYSFAAEVRRHDSNSAWFFLGVPEPDADDIEAEFGANAGGFGSIRVKATIGETRWRTSLFPDSKRGTYVLPVKKAVRVAEHLDHGTVTPVTLEILA